MLLAIPPLATIDDHTAAGDGDGAGATVLAARIKYGLERILRPAFGYQRVLNVSRLGTARPEAADSVFYGVHLLSTGHRDTRDPEDLIRDRLREGLLPAIGPVDRLQSRVKLVQARIEGEMWLWAVVLCLCVCVCEE